MNNLELIDTEQNLFDHFNGFILSKDTKIFGKMLARTLLANQVKNVVGDIVECGVFKGTGMFTFLKLKRFLCPNSHKKVVGFDFFDSHKLLESLSGNDKTAMTSLFETRMYSHSQSHRDIFYSFIIQNGFEPHEFDLIPGDVSTTTYEYVNANPGFRISLLYLDLDLEEPTYHALCALWDRVSIGGIVVFDEYAYHVWSEANGVDKFFKDKGVEIISLNFLCPTAYVIKR